MQQATSMSKALEVLLQLTEAGKHEGIQKLVGALPLQTVQLHESVGLLATLINLTYKQQDSVTLRCLMEAWSNKHSEFLPSQLLDVLEFEVLQFLVKYTEYSLHEYVLDLAATPSIFWQAQLELLLKLFPQADIEQLDTIIQHVSEEGEREDHPFLPLLRAVRNQRNTAELPPYLKPETSDCPTSHPAWAQLPKDTRSKLLKLAPSFVKRSEDDATLEAEEQHILFDYNTSGLRTRYAILDLQLPTALPSAEEEVEVFRHLGPLNSSWEGEPGMPPCDRYGGCRMFTCTCYVVEDDSEEEEEDLFLEEELRRGRNWFTGECGECCQRIATPKAALRIPEFGGGWIGCYCSRACVKRQEALSGIQLTVIEKVITQLSVYGAYYRAE